MKYKFNFTFNKLQKYLITSQVLLFLGIIICIIIRPKGLKVDNGISYYGTHINTLVFYIISLAGSAFIAILAAIKYIKKEYESIRSFLFILFPLTLAIILFPYNVNSTYRIIHEYSGILIFLIQLIISIVILFKIYRDRFNIFLFIIQILGGLISAYYLAPSQGFLIQGQLLFQLAFGILIIRSSHLLTNET